MNIIYWVDMGQKLANKVAVVTGGSKGIGAAIAFHLAANGAFVIINYSKSKEEAEKLVKKIEANKGKAAAIQANMKNENDIKLFFQEVKKAHGKLDILVNNAGVYEFAPIEKITVELYHKMFDVNVMGLLLATREAVKIFSDRGAVIINISSVASKAFFEEASIYCGTKGAVDAITRSLAKELGPRKIRVNSINPGLVETEGTQSEGISDGDFRKDVESNTPLGRIGKPEDIAEAALFLASDDSSWITGESLFITGGKR